jgi:hypothetical protein
MAIAGPAGTTAWMKKLWGERDRIRKTAAYEVLNALRLRLE